MNIIIIANLCQGKLNILNCCIDIMNNYVYNYEYNYIFILQV